MILVPIIVPVIFGICVLLLPQFKDRKVLIPTVVAGLLTTAVAIVYTAFGKMSSINCFNLMDKVPISFSVDGMGRVFVLVMLVLWLSAGIYGITYMKHEEANHRYFGYYLITYGVLVALCYSDNLITYYSFYEMMTLASVALVLHNRSHEAVIAGLKYMFYSFCGAYMVLYGIYFLYKYTNGDMSFRAGGVLSPEAVASHGAFILVITFFMILGFGVKAGMFPLHGWLPTAHPVAPAPASAVLSGFIVKGGVLGIIRTVFYIVGVDNLRGTWVQIAWMCLTLFTVFMGSMLAYSEKVLKKRLAYSTVSQVSYILFGLSVMNQTALEGSLLHVICHAIIKCGLFLSAGAIIYATGRTRVDELRGIGKKMPALIGAYTILSLGLIGIPPTGGFISKWYLCIGSLEGGMKIFAWLGPVVLLVSALLTAGYLLPITIVGFFPGEDYEDDGEKIKLEKKMLYPVVILAILVCIIGLFPNAIVNNLISITTNLF